MRSILFFLFIFGWFVSHAQNQELYLQTFTKQQGVPQHRITSITQDANGRMWFGTSHGVYTFDGYNFIDINNFSSVKLSEIHCMIQVSDTIMFVGTSMGLYKIHNQTYTTTPILTQKKITSIIHVTPNTIAFSGIGSRNLYRCTFDQTTQSYSIDSTEYPHEITKIYRDSKQRMWLLKSPHSITMHNTQGIHNIALPSNSQQLLLIDIVEYSNSILLGTSRGLYIFNEAEQRFVLFPIEKTNSNELFITDFELSKNGNLYISTDNQGILMYTKHSTIVPIIPNNSSIHNSVFTIYEDALKNLWISTLGNNLQYIRFIQQPIGNYLNTNQSNLTENMVKTTFRDSNATLWLGTDGGGICFIPNSHSHTTVYELANSPKKIMTFEQQGNTLWVGTYVNGLHAIDLKTKKIIPHPIYIGKTAIQNIFDIEILNAHTLLLATLGTGLIQYDIRTKKATHIHTIPFGKETFQIDAFLSSICKDMNGNIWIGGYGQGVVVCNPQMEAIQVLNEFTQTHTITNDNVYDLQLDSNGNMWIATWQGITQVNTRTFSITKYATQEFPAFSQCYAMEWHKQILWIATGGGLVSFDTTHNTTQTYSDKRGIYSLASQCNHITLVNNTWLVAGGNNGVSIVPIEKLSSLAKPQLQFRAITIIQHGTIVPQSSHIQLPHNNNTLRIVFPIIDFIHNFDIEYSYKIAEESKDKQFLGNSYELQLTNMSPGTYTITLYARYKQHSESETSYTFTITITPPFWQTWWFRLCIVIIMCITIFYSIRLRLYRMKKQAFILEQKVTERTKEILSQKEELQVQTEKLQEINDELLRTNSEQSKLFEILSKKAEPLQPMLPKSHDEELLEKTMVYIHEHISNPNLSIEDISNHLCITKIQLYRKIKSLTGLTPIDILKTTRLKVAEEMLLQNKYSISEICFHVGFTEPKYFSKCFKEQYSVSPSDFLKNKFIH